MSSQSLQEEADLPELQTNKESYLLHLFSGATAGLLSDAVVHPIDTCRTRLQVQQGTGSSLVYKGTVDTITKIVSQEGWKALYKGFVVVASFTVPAHALYFYGYEKTKRLVLPDTPMEEKGAIVHFIAGCVADVFGALVWVPQDVVKQRLQVQTNSMRKEAKAGNTVAPRYKGSLHCIKTIIQEEGFFALWTGFMPALAVYGPFVGIYFAAYEESKQIFKRKLNVPLDELPAWCHIVGGGGAGALAAAITAPLDVVKTRIQVGVGYANTRHAIKTIWKTEGLAAFFRGMGARTLWIAPGTAITIAAYEQCKKFFGILM